MHDRKKFIETSPPGKEFFYNHLNMEDISDADCVHAKRDCKDFEINFFQNIMIWIFKVIHYLLVDVFQDFGNICLKKYELDRTKFVSAPGLAWQADFKKSKVKLDLLTDIDVI